MTAEAHDLTDGDIAGLSAYYASLKPTKRTDEINARPAAARAIALKDRFSFKATMDDAARAVMFKHLAAQPA